MGQYQRLSELAAGLVHREVNVTIPIVFVGGGVLVGKGRCANWLPCSRDRLPAISAGSNMRRRDR
jgi:hypothetical protein